MTIKITVTGVGGSGKTTLSGKLADNLSIPLIPEIGRLLCAELGYERIGEVPDQEGFKRMALERQIAAEKEHASYVADRCVIDCWVLWQRWNICSAMSYDTEAIYRTVAGHAPIYSHIVYLPPRFEVQEDGFRWTDPDYIQQVDRIFRMTFFDLQLQERVLMLKTDTVDERLAEVKDWLGKAS